MVRRGDVCDFYPVKTTHGEHIYACIENEVGLFDTGGNLVRKIPFFTEPKSIIVQNNKMIVSTDVEIYTVCNMLTAIIHHEKRVSGLISVWCVRTSSQV